jgi:hypothetical protein
MFTLGMAAGCGGGGNSGVGSPNEGGVPAGGVTMVRLEAQVVWPDSAEGMEDPLAAARSVRIVVADIRSGAVAFERLVRREDASGSPASAGFVQGSVPLHADYLMAATAYAAVDGSGPPLGSCMVAADTTGDGHDPATSGNPPTLSRRFTVGGPVLRFASGEEGVVLWPGSDTHVLVVTAAAPTISPDAFYNASLRPTGAVRWSVADTAELSAEKLLLAGDGAVLLRARRADRGGGTTVTFTDDSSGRTTAIPIAVLKAAPPDLLMLRDHGSIVTRVNVRGEVLGTYPLGVTGHGFTVDEAGRLRVLSTESNVPYRPGIATFDLRTMQMTAYQPFPAPQEVPSLLSPPVAVGGYLFFSGLSSDGLPGTTPRYTLFRVDGRHPERAVYPEPFTQGTQYAAVTSSPDGLLYAVRSGQYYPVVDPANYIDVFDPETLGLRRTIKLPAGVFPTQVGVDGVLFGYSPFGAEGGGEGLMRFDHEGREITGSPTATRLYPRLLTRSRTGSLATIGEVSLGRQAICFADDSLAALAPVVLRSRVGLMRAITFAEPGPS